MARSDRGIVIQDIGYPCSIERKPIAGKRKYLCFGAVEQKGPLIFEGEGHRDGTVGPKTIRNF